jgi:threonine dehydrogenase-like Zn-dependent dehydrogenase
MIMGHEFCGTVEEAGDAASDFRKGDRVVVQPVVFCGRCPFCRQGMTNLCANRRFFGVMDCSGSMAEYLSVPAKLLYRMPAAMDMEIGAMVEPLAVAYRAVHRAAELIEGNTILIVGAGTIGLLLLALVKLQNPRTVVVSDLSETRLRLARQIGADAAVNPSHDDIMNVVGELSGGRGAGVSFEAVGVEATVEQALACLRPRGTCVWVGNSQKMIPVDMQRSVTRELSVLGSYIYSHIEFGEALQVLAQERIDVRPIISRRVTLDQGPEMFAALSDPSTELVKVILTS